MSLLFSFGTNFSLSANSEEIWTDFTFCSCKPSHLDIYDNQLNINDYSVDEKIEPESFTLELNITSMTDTLLEIFRYTNFVNETGSIYEQGSKYINSFGYQSFVINANRIVIRLIANSTELEFHSIHGLYRLVAENGSEIINWEDFSLWNCAPTDRLIFDDGYNVHNITTHLKLSEVGNGTFYLHYYKGRTETEALITEYTSNGTYSLNEQGRNIYMVYFGENGTFAKGSYLVEDLGMLYRDAEGFPFYIPVLMAMVLTLLRKRKKIKD